MILAAIILGSLSLICLITWAIRFFSYDEGAIAGMLGIVLGVAWLVCFLTCLNWQISSQELTGYIYSSSTTRGFTTAHIRFSENAGTDAQPEFCVKADSVPGRAIEKYTGSGVRVRVNIPSFFYFSNNPFTCGTTNMTIQKVTNG